MLSFWAQFLGKKPENFVYGRVRRPNFGFGFGAWIFGRLRILSATFWAILTGVILTGVILIGSAGCIGTGLSTTCGVILTLWYLPKSFSDWVYLEGEEGDTGQLLLFLWTCFDHFDFLLRLWEPEEIQLDENKEEDDRCLLFFFVVLHLLVCSLCDSLAWDELLSIDW